MLAGLKEDAATRSIPTLALISPDTALEKERFQAAGVDDFLTKPLNLDELLLCVRLHEHEPSEGE